MHPSKLRLSHQSIDLRRKEFDEFVKSNKNDDIAVFLKLLEKNPKNAYEVDFLIEFLKKYQKFTNILKDATQNFLEPLTALVYKISPLTFNKNTVIFRYGNISDKFYLILEGRVSIVVPKEITVELNEEEYLEYLINLKKFNEITLLKILVNKNQFFLKDRDLEIWLKGESIQSIENRIRSSRFKTIEYSDPDSNISVADYIKRIEPPVKESAFRRKEVKIYKYYEMKDLEEGDKFGDFGLSSITLKRNATIITKLDSIFGCISKNDFDLILKQSIEKQKRITMNFLSQTKIFSDLDNDILRKIYSNFYIESISKNSFIFKSGQEQKYIYVIKNGEFEITSKDTIQEINTKIKNLGGNIHEEFMEEFQMKSDENYSEFFSKPFFSKFSYSKEGDILGLDDMIIDKKFTFNVECVSVKGEYYRFEPEILNVLSQKNPKFEKSVYEYIDFKKKKLLEMFLNIKKIKISAYQLIKEKNSAKDLNSKPKLPFNLKTKKNNIPTFPEKQKVIVKIKKHREDSRNKQNSNKMTIIPTDSIASTTSLINVKSNPNFSERNDEKIKNPLNLPTLHCHTHSQTNETQTSRSQIDSSQMKILVNINSERDLYNKMFSEYIDQKTKRENKSLIDILVYDKFNDVYNQAIYGNKKSQSKSIFRKFVLKNRKKSESKKSKEIF